MKCTQGTIGILHKMKRIRAEDDIDRIDVGGQFLSSGFDPPGLRILGHSFPRSLQHFRTGIGTDRAQVGPQTAQLIQQHPRAATDIQH